MTLSVLAAFGLAGLTWWASRALLDFAAAVMNLGTTGAMGYGPQEVVLWVLMTLTGLKWWLIRLLAIILPAIAISAEREHFSWDPLVLTRLTPKDILFGKVMARLLPCIAIALFFLPAELILLAAEWRLVPSQFAQQSSGLLPGAPLVVGWSVEVVLQILSVVAYASIALLWSLLSRRTILAVLGSIVTVIGLGVVSVMLSTLLLFAFGYFGEVMEFIRQAMTSGGSPAAQPVVGLEAMSKTVWVFTGYRLALALAVILVLWRLMTRRFYRWDRWVRGAGAPAPPRRAFGGPPAAAPAATG